MFFFFFLWGGGGAGVICVFHFIFFICINMSCIDILPVSDAPFLKLFVHSCWSCNKALDLLKLCFNLIFPQLTVVSVSFAMTGSGVVQWLSCWPNIARIAGSVLRSFD